MACYLEKFRGFQNITTKAKVKRLRRSQETAEVWYNRCILGNHKHGLFWLIHSFVVEGPRIWREAALLARLSHPSGMAFILLLYGDTVSHFTGLSVATLVMRFFIMRLRRWRNRCPGCFYMKRFYYTWNGSHLSFDSSHLAGLPLFPHKHM